MKAFEESSVLLLASLVFCAGTASAQNPVPRIFFTDLTSGPDSGGEDVGGFSGAYVTIYGNNFGATRGSSTITLNDSACLRVVSWGVVHLWYQEIVVQLGGSCTSGDFSVTVDGTPSTVASINLNGAPTNPAAFSVRPGNIYCVSTTGSDSNGGTFPSQCWASLGYAVGAISPGDIIYARDGVTATDDGAVYNAALILGSPGQTGNPKALVAYPGAIVTIGDPNGQQRGLLLCSGLSACADGSFWVTAKLVIRASGSAIQSNSVHDNSFVGNDLSCPNGDGATACAEFVLNGQLLYGNVIGVAGSVGASKLYHGVYFSAENDSTDVGWNHIHDVRGCRGIQFHEDGGPDMTDIHIHDNLIHDTVCDGINLNTVDADTGIVEVFNNVLYDVGKGPEPPDGLSSYSCINANSIASSEIVGVEIFNNVCFDAGSQGGSTAGAISIKSRAVLRNNLIYQTNGQPYIVPDSGCARIESGSTNNNWFGNGAAPTCAGLANNLNVDPNVVDTAIPDFHLRATSPMIDAGVPLSNLTADHDGNHRPQNAAHDIGPYEFTAGGTAGTGGSGSGGAGGSGSGGAEGTGAGGTGGVSTDVPGVLVGCSCHGTGPDALWMALGLLGLGLRSRRRTA